ncbi:MAG TPA: BON domain-containing protein [Vicinamibacterales bacterium]|nr:BON domain-containing protein [Vicinamibacterales bacterium]
MRDARSWFGEDDPRRRRGNDREDRHPYDGERHARFEPSRSSGYDHRDDRDSRWEGGSDDRFGYGGAIGMYRTDDRVYHDRYRDYRERYDTDRDERYERGDRDNAANDYYRAARAQRDDYLRWSVQNAAEWNDSPVQRDERLPSVGRRDRERGGYWRQYEQNRPHYVGRGPKDYRRSDDRIREEICDCMTDDPALDASDVVVEVKQGEVTLTGSVTSRDQKRRAEDLAERISGVKDVTNQLRVQRGADGHNWSADPSWGHGQGTTSSQPVSEASGKGTPSKSTSGSTA